MRAFHVALALAALAAGATGQVKTITTGPACAKAPPKVLSFLGDLPPPPADALCGYLLAPKPGVTTCDEIAVIESALGQGTVAPSRTCEPTAQYTLEYDPSPLNDERPLPAGTFDDVPEVFAAEGSTFYWLYSVVRNLENWLPCYQEGREWPPPAGWTVHTTVSLDEDGVETPFGVVMSKNSTDQVVVAIRGTMTPYEWLLDFTYNQTTADPDVFGVPVHAGFGTAFSEIWPDIQSALGELVVNASKPKQVFVVGHSLGAAVATLVSYAAQSYLNEGMGDQAPVVDTALMAPPSVGGPDFAAKFNPLVNARRVAFQFDIVPQVPCSPEMPACSKDSVNLLLRSAGIDVIPSNEPGNVAQWNYSDVGGSLPIQADEMPQNKAAWPGLQDIQLCWAPQFLFATHVCSYSCFTSQFAPSPAVNESNCWLTQRPAGAEGSYCLDWPTNYPYMTGAAPVPAPAP